MIIIKDLQDARGLGRITQVMRVDKKNKRLPHTNLSGFNKRLK